MDDVTLQINISPGDINYAHLTVPALVSQHTNIKKRLLVVDRCRPQKTTILDPDVRFPAEKFEKDAQTITSIANNLLAVGVVSDLYFLDPGDPVIKRLSEKYLRGLYETTHGAGGMVNMGYWIGFDLPNTKYLLHYDGDIMLYQQPGYDWVKNAINEMEPKPEVLMAVPRLCPPIAADMPSAHEGRPFQSYDNYWINDWFSTRHFLLDKRRLEKCLPLVRGRVMIELLIRKYAGRAFPLDPEILMFKSLSPRGVKRLMLKSQNVWLLHPVIKSPAFLEKLPQIIAAISAGKYPEEQKGLENIDLDAWLKFL
ncbi:MAG: hypothetical protein V4520_11135 [Bacteroidota bacterium]